MNSHRKYFPESDREAFRRAVQGARVLVSTHIHPDPDAVGSVLAMREILQRLGANVSVVLQDKVPSRCRALPQAGEILHYPETHFDEAFRVAVILDSGSRSRIGDVQSLIAPDAILFNFDHHLSNDRFGTVVIADADYCSTTELLFFFCRELPLSLTAGLAENIYAGVLTDTGRFRFSNTSARTLYVAAELLEAGADAVKITNALYYDVPAADILSCGIIYSSLEFFGGGEIGIMSVRKEHLVEDPDTVVETALSIRGVEVAALFSEAPEGKIRVSLRSKNSVNVAAIAEQFGGGGHERAAGCRVRGTMEKVRERIIPVLLEVVRADCPSHKAEVI